MPLPLNIRDLEQAKFVDDSGSVCIRVVEDDNEDVAVTFLAV